MIGCSVGAGDSYVDVEAGSVVDGGFSFGRVVCDSLSEVGAV